MRPSRGGKEEHHYMATKTNIHIVVEITSADQRKLDFDQHEVTGRQIKEATSATINMNLL